MLDPVPSRVREYADQAVAYVQRALGIKLEYDSDTLPVLDHYLRTTPDDWRSQIAGGGDPDGIAGGAGVLPRGINQSINQSINRKEIASSDQSSYVSW